jgi:hypothetical protein
MPVGGGEEKQIGSGHLTSSANYVIVDDGIYFTKAGGTLEFLDSKSGKSRTVAKIDKLWFLGLAISPDHRWILASILDQTLNDLMLVENFDGLPNPLKDFIGMDIRHFFRLWRRTWPPISRPKARLGPRDDPPRRTRRKPEGPEQRISSY